MLAITTSAKSLDFTSEYSTPFDSQPAFLKEAEELVSVLKKMKREELMKTMEISKELAELNYERFQQWKPKHVCDYARPAIVAYDGDIYQQMHEKEYSEAQAKYLQNTLRIVSGLYGLLRPYDLIQPYRLEMKTLLATGIANNLYEFWDGKLTAFLNSEIQERNHEYVINLASAEYAKAIKNQDLLVPMINIEFHQKKADQVTNYGLLAKKARGMMIDYIVKNQLYDVVQLENFDTDGYKLSEKTSTSLIFMKDM